MPPRRNQNQQNQDLAMDELHREIQRLHTRLGMGVVIVVLDLIIRMNIENVRWIIPSIHMNTIIFNKKMSLEEYISEFEQLMIKCGVTEPEEHTIAYSYRDYVQQ